MKIGGLVATVSGIAVLCATTGVAAAQSAGEPLTGTAAFGGWQESEPGVQRLIRPEDMPEPAPGEAAENFPDVVAMPEGARPQVPEGFEVTMVASGFEAPRIIRRAPNGDLFVVDSATNELHALRLGDDGEVEERGVFASDLNQPYGVAFYPQEDPQSVYVANTDSVVRFPYSDGDLEAAGEPETVVDVLPAGHHWTRDIVFSPDGDRLYVAVGSGSNVAEQVHFPPKGGQERFIENNPLGMMWGNEENRATVLSFTPEGEDMRVYATGLRNCSGLTVQPATGELWCAVNERDGLGDNVPPDYATSVAEGAFYGWPWYYIGDNEDPRDHLKGVRPDLAGQVTVPDVLFQAHSAPLGIEFYTGDAFPAEYRGDAFVAMHGSWNRGARTGYKVVRVHFGDANEPTGVYEDFMTGFVESAESVWGRPVGVAVGDDGSLFVTEDGNGTIWRVTYGPRES